MSCLFDSVAALLRDRPDLAPLRCAALDGRTVPWPPTGRALRASVCALLTSIKVHDIGLDEWGAMEAGTSSAAYVTRMRDEGTWGGGVEIVALADALRVPIEVSGAASAVFGEAYRHAMPLRLHYTGAHYTPEHAQVTESAWSPTFGDARASAAPRTRSAPGAL